MPSGPEDTAAPTSPIEPDTGTPTEPSGPEPVAAEAPERSGCGCDSSGGPRGAWLALVVVALGRRRRATREA